MAECVNLGKRFCKRYRISFDPAYDPRHRSKGKRDPWMMILETRSGAIVPHGGTLLVAEVDGHRKAKAQFSRLPCCRVHQDGHDFGAFIFDVADFDEVAKIVRPYRMSQLSVEQKRQAAVRLAPYQFGTR